MTMASMTRIALQKRLLDDWQRGLPLERRPFAAIAAQLGVRESDVIAGLQKLKADGTIARVGGVVRPNTLGCSTLFAMQVPDLDVSATA